MKMVDAAGQRWPAGWVKGEGFVRPVGEADERRAPHWSAGFDQLSEVRDLRRSASGYISRTLVGPSVPAA
jgi:hypothetical protein